MPVSLIRVSIAINCPKVSAPGALAFSSVLAPPATQPAVLAPPGCTRTRVMVIFWSRNFGGNTPDRIKVLKSTSV